MSDEIDEVRLTLRLPVSLRDKLSRGIEKSGRSLNAEMVQRLESSFSDESESKWKRMYEEEHKAYERLEVLYGKSENLNLSVQSVANSAEAQMLRMAHDIEWLSAMVLSLQGPPTTEVAQLVEGIRRATRRVTDRIYSKETPPLPEGGPEP